QRMSTIALASILCLYLIVLAHRWGNQAVRRRATLAETALDCCPEAMLLLDRTGQIRQFNRAAEQLFGYKAGQVIGQHLSLLLMPESDASHRAKLPQLL